MISPETEDSDPAEDVIRRRPSISRRIYQSQAEYEADERELRRSSEQWASRHSPAKSPEFAAPLIVGVVEPRRFTPSYASRAVLYDLADVEAGTERERTSPQKSRRSPPPSRKLTPGISRRSSASQPRTLRQSLSRNVSDNSSTGSTTDESSAEMLTAPLEPFHRRRVRSSDLQDILAMSPREDIEAFTGEDAIFPTIDYSAKSSTRASPGTVTDSEFVTDNEASSTSRPKRAKFFDTELKRANYHTGKNWHQRSTSIAPISVASLSRASGKAAATVAALDAANKRHSTEIPTSYAIPRAASIRRYSERRHSRAPSTDSSTEDELDLVPAATTEVSDMIWEDRDGKQEMVAGTLEQLVNHYIYNVQDSTSIRQFILAKCCFCSASKLLSILVSLFNSSHELESVADRSQIQIRVINFLKKWIGLLPEDFEETSAQKKLDRFLSGLMDAKETETWAKLVTSTWSIASSELKKQRAVLKGREEATEETLAGSVIPSKISKMESLYLSGPEHAKIWKNFELFDVSHEEFARQLTLVDQRKFAKIPFAELLEKRWENAVESPHVALMNKHFNKMSLWVGSAVVKEYTPKKRAKVLTYLINVADYLVVLRNFFGAMAITIGLAQAAISRLSSTWEKLSSNTQDKWKRLSSMATPIGNFKLLRALQEAPGASSQLISPTVLFRDLLFIQDGNNDFYDQELALLNFEKIMLYGKVFDLFYLSRVPYPFKHLKVIQKFISHFFCLSEDEMMRVSHTVESHH